jgi:predicted short-subunit dehydrogenase-like oxidoreductase (DUF2520 family)
MSDKICLIGSGNLGTNLGYALHKSGFKVHQVISRNIENAKELALQLKADYSDTIQDIFDDTDIIIFAVNDDALSGLIQDLGQTDKLLIHTAGSVSSDIFSPSSNCYGVLYPLQSFRQDEQLNFSDIPILIEGSNSSSFNRIKHLAKGISTKVIEINSEQRLSLHIAAVFACNFTNHIYTIADELLKENELDFTILQALIKHTTERVLHQGNPASHQTGPAIRNDQNTIQAHLAALSKKPSVQELYKLMSNRIFETKENTL